MKKILFIFITFCLLIVPLSVNFTVFADSDLIVCDDTPGSTLPPCSYNKLIELAQNFINFLILIAIPLAALSFSWAGFLIMTAGGNQGQRERGKDVFIKVAKGLIFMLAAWLIVDLILSALLKDGYSILE
jgi:hypothetical protein